MLENAHSRLIQSFWILFDSITYDYRRMMYLLESKITRETYIKPDEISLTFVKVSKLISQQEILATMTLYFESRLFKDVTYILICVYKRLS